MKLGYFKNKVLERGFALLLESLELHLGEWKENNFILIAAVQFKYIYWFPNSGACREVVQTVL